MAKHPALPVVDVDRCTGCGWCVAVCPPHVLSLHAHDGHKHSVLDDADGCIGCALCAVRCPFDAITMVRIDRLEGRADGSPVGLAGTQCRHADNRRMNESAPSGTLDTTRIDDLRIRAVRPLITPALLQEWLPAPEVAQDLVAASRAAIARVLHGRDDRLVVVVGPCSIHDHDEALEYARRLAGETRALADALLIVMRVYFEKPRTTVGWKGYINDPHLDGSYAINEGLQRARRLLLDILALGLPVGTEFLDLLSPQFISDLVSWGAIGARTTESPSHRQLASGLSSPVGFKNGTDGGVKVAADAIVAAQAPHAFLGLTKMGQAAVFETRGNQDCHVILRGGKAPNYSAVDVAAACALLKAAGLREQVMIDCSHANSGKQHQRQIQVAADVAAQVRAGDARIMGVMIESHLHEGRQDIVAGQPLRPGVSVTDACIGFEQTVPVLAQLAEAVRGRRSPAKRR